ncbi:MAG TPA: filamentous hemagglutinin N-terminal domain-containing protein, partial [Candidatus Methylacidiphilales bacterium]|nr:filamentous hemagglutinin N-terminal domain-containing protein [Candidatus Methylacidiphilales bacterium]
MWMALPMHLGIVQANPAGGSVQTGSASISTGPSGVTVTQGSDRAVINWNSFSIDQGKTTTFVQPGNKSAVLNRVTGGSASQINGNLNANGQVYLVNKNGVVVGKTGRVNTAGFTASTHDVSNNEFMVGGDMTFRGNSTARVQNFGKIKATDGDVTLIAREVENNGRISAKKGSVNLAGGTEVLLKPSGTDGQRVFIRSGSGSVANTGTIRATAAELRAAGGNEYALAVNNSGVIRATGVDKSGGRIVLKAEGSDVASVNGSSNSKASGTVRNSGKLIAKAKAPGRNGGSIVVTGEHVNLATTSVIDASGSSYQGNGGTVNIGGGFQGIDATIANAKTTVVEKGSTINVDGGTGSAGGTGGTAVVWSDVATFFRGDISARGAVNSDGTPLPGTGGFVEVSSKGYLNFNGTVNTAGGTLLLDPNDIYIASAPNDDIDFTTPGNIFGNGTDGSSVLNVGVLTNAGTGLLLNNNVVIQTSSGNTAPQGGTITVRGDIVWNSPHSLTLLAHNYILVAADVRNTYSGTLSGSNDASINMIAGWSGDLSNIGQNFSQITSNTANYGSTGSGVVYFNLTTSSNSVNVSSFKGDVNIAGYSVQLLASDFIINAYSQVGYRGPNATGNINILAKDIVNVQAGPANGSYAHIGHGGPGISMGTTSGNITISVPNSGGLNMSVRGGDVANSYAMVGHGGPNATATGITGDITINDLRFLTLGSTTSQSHSQIGHGGPQFAGPISGNIGISSWTGPSTEMNLIAGNVAGSYAQIGNGGRLATGNTLSGNISISGLQILTLTGGGRAYALIGHGGDSNNAGVSLASLPPIAGDITILGASSGMSVALNGGGPTYFDTFAQIGHGGRLADARSVSGDITLTNLLYSTATLAGITTQSAGSTGYTQIGHGGVEFEQLDPAGAIQGLITLSGVSSGSYQISLSGGGNANGYSQIGHGGFGARARTIQTSSILISGVSDLNLNAGSRGYVQIGNGGHLSQVTNGIGGNISITGTSTGMNVRMMAGSIANSRGEAQIGHGGGYGQAQSITGNILLDNVASVLLRGNANYAQLGHGGYQYNYVNNILGTLAGTITINGLASTGTSVTLAGGNTADQAYAQIGHGGREGQAASISTAAISLTNVHTMGLTAGSAGYTQIGHGGSLYNTTRDIDGTLSGNISISGISTGMAVTLTGGGANTVVYSQIGHGGYTAQALSITGANISMTNVGLLTVNGGERYAQIGHGGARFNLDGNVSGTIAGNITINGHAGSGMAVNVSDGNLTVDGYGQIGHGGYNSQAGTITSADITLTGVNSLNILSRISYAHVGHGGYYFNTTNNILGTLAGDITIDGRAISTVASVTLTGGNTNNFGYAQIGHGGYQSQTQSILGSNIRLSNLRSLGITGGAFNYAMVGHGGYQMNRVRNLPSSVISGNIIISGQASAGMTVDLRSGSGINSFAQIGNGGHQAQALSITSADVTLNNVTNLNLTSAVDYTMVGNGGWLFNYDGNLSGVIIGNISINGLTATGTDVVLVGGTDATRSFAQIGNGGYASQAQTLSGADILLTNVKKLNLTGNASSAQIGHGGYLFNTDHNIGGTIAGTITINGFATGMAVNLIAGNNVQRGFALIGHGGTNSQSTGIFGAITLTNVSDLHAESNLAYAQIGHGAYQYNSTNVLGGNVSGDISISSIATGAQVRIDAGTLDYAYAQIGHGGLGAHLLGQASGNITIAVSGGSQSFFLQGGPASEAFAQIGHQFSSSLNSTGNSITGNVGVSFGSYFLASVPTGAVVNRNFANVGHSGNINSVAGNISVAGTRSNSVLELTASNTSYGGYVRIGHNNLGVLFVGPGFVGETTGDITVTTGDATLRGGDEIHAQANIGHAASPSGVTKGNISVTVARDLYLQSGGNVYSPAVIGHGLATSAFAPVGIQGQIVVRVGGETSLVGSVAPAWLGHLGLPSGASMAEVLLITNTLDNSSGTATGSTITGDFANNINFITRGGNFTLVSGTDLTVGAEIQNYSPGSLNLLSRRGVTINAPISDTTGLAELNIVAGFNGIWGILGIPGTALVNPSLFFRPSSTAADVVINTGFGVDSTTTVAAFAQTNIAAGRSVIFNTGTKSAAKTLFVLTDNINTTRPNAGADSYFTNRGTISATGAQIFAVRPENATLGNLSYLPSRTDIWYGDSGALAIGINYKLGAAVVDPT